MNILHHYLAFWGWAQTKIPDWALKIKFVHAISFSIMVLPVLIAWITLPLLTTPTPTIELAVYIPCGLTGWIAGTAFYAWVVINSNRED